MGDDYSPALIAAPTLQYKYMWFLITKSGFLTCLTPPDYISRTVYPCTVHFILLNVTTILDCLLTGLLAMSIWEFFEVI